MVNYYYASMKIEKWKVFYSHGKKNRKKSQWKSKTAEETDDNAWYAGGGGKGRPG